MRYTRPVKTYKNAHSMSWYNAAKICRRPK